MVKFKYYTKEDILHYTSPREGEVKLGQNLKTGLDSNSKYAIIGLPESIGVKQNKGIGGTETLWPDFLKSFCNIQATDALPGSNITIVGHLEIERNVTVEDIDIYVTKLITEVLNSGNTPIIIGGGHNNSYGNIKGSSLHFNQPINVINLDPHADFRRLEGRHSGNGFSYAMHEGLLEKYAVIGLHRNYNSKAMIDQMDQNPNINYSFYEDIFIKELLTFKNAIQNAQSFTQKRPTGIEIDLDSIEYSLTSAMTPCGLQSKDVRLFIDTISQLSQIAYLHIAEGASKLENGNINPMLGKLVSYLVSDFVRGKFRM
jgi:formiminoglutamase